MPAKSSALVDTCVIYCGDNLEQLRKLPDACADLIYFVPRARAGFANRPRRLDARFFPATTAFTKSAMVCVKLCS
jgi:hypothetical protein